MGKVNFVYLLILSTYLTFCKGNEGKNVIVEIEDGEILGTFSQTVTGREYSNFKGIPYAKPPVCETNIKTHL